MISYDFILSPRIG